MLEKFNIECQRVISLAESLAFSYSHSCIGSEHILLAVLKNCRDIFTEELNKYGLFYNNLAERIKNLYPISEKEPLYMEYTVELKDTLNFAQKIARQQKYSQVSLVHLEIALLNTSKNVANEIISKYHLNIENLTEILKSSYSRKSILDDVVDLTRLGVKRKDRLIGRKKELDQLIHALSRRNKPNAILVGEPGVGKTAIVEELAELLINNQIPLLEGKMIYELDISSTVAGTKYRGEFEEKIKKIINKVKEDGNAILFIDEIHNIIKAGGAEGAIDAANILKPYLSRGEIQVIGATTEDEFMMSFEKDKALKRRFQLIKVLPSSIEETKEIMMGIKDIYESHYHVKINEKEIDYIIDFCKDHLTQYYFPDKAIDLLDNSLVNAKKVLKIENINDTIASYFNQKGLNNKEINIIKLQLKKEIVGQKNVIDKLIYNLEIAQNTRNKNKPYLSLLICGPGGCGKSTLVNSLSFLLGLEDETIFIDSCQCQDTFSISRLAGLSINEQSQLVHILNRNPCSLVVFDSFDKASVELLSFCNFILDKGYFMSFGDSRVDCSNALFIFLVTSNQEDYQMNDFSLEYSDSNKYVKKRYPNYFLSRLDDCLIMDNISRQDMVKFSKQYLKNYHDLEISSEIFNDINNTQLFNNGYRIVEKRLKTYLFEKEKQKIQ